MTGTQKLLAAGAGAGALILTIVLVTRKDDGSTKPRPGAEPTSSAVVAPPPTTVATSPTAVPSATVALTAPVATAEPVYAGPDAPVVNEARTLLRAGEPRKAVAVIERWEKLPENITLSPEMTLVKIEALSKSGRRTDALALGLSSRDDPKLDAHQPRIQALLQDAGLIGEPAPPAIP